MNHMSEQLEFDLVSPFLAPPSMKEIESVRKRSGFPVPECLKEFRALQGLTARLNHLDLVYDQNSVSINDELRELRVLIGEEFWRKDGKKWKRRARKDPLMLRKIIVCIKHQLKIN